MALQRTAYEACSRKVHCVAKHYLDDPFVSFFAKDLTIVNSPLMNRGTWLRTKAIEQCVLTFAARAQDQPIQLISFGAGVDTLYFRLAKDHPELRFRAYVELDLADLVAEKRRVIERHTVLSSLVRPDYVLQATDLRQPAETARLLRSYIEPGVPTILLAEMVFVYLEATVSTELLRTIMHDVLSPQTHVELITYDAMQPADRFGQMMVSTLAGRGVHLRGIADLPTPEAHAQRCRELGFTTVQAVSMRQLYLTVPRPTQLWLNSLEMIDDWDEWNLVHDHYCFVIALNYDDELPKIFDTSSA